MINEFHTEFLKPGDLKTSSGPSKFTTVLGSCISVCLYDRSSHKAGMTHFIFPEDRKSEDTDYFGDTSTVHLIEYMLKNGSRTEDLVASIVGGASSFSMKYSESAGQKNIKIAKKILGEWGIRIKFEVTGGCHGRKVVYLTDTNEFQISELHDCLGMCKKEGKGCQFRVTMS